jgi:hypothetical protein
MTAVFGLVLVLALAISGVLVTHRVLIASQSSNATMSGRERSHAPAITMCPSCGASNLAASAVSELRDLVPQLTFRPYLLPSLALPTGDAYFKSFLDIAGQVPGNGLNIFITSKPDASDNGRGIYIDEARVTPADASNPRFPLNAFRRILKPATLSNGLWYEMQLGPDNPWPGSWELHALRGNVFIIVQGVDSREHLEEVAGALTQDWAR